MSTVSSYGGASGRLLRLALGICALLALSCTYAARAQAAEPFFMRQTGGMFHYPRESNTTFASVKTRIEMGYYSSRGIRNLIFYCPYKATEEFRGVPAVDHFATNPNTGTVADFGAMATAAHAHGMAVVAYMGLLFFDPTAPIWVKAQKDHKAGTASKEAKMFLWADEAEGETADYGGWEYSDAAGSFFATSWERPAIYLGSAEGREYVKSVLKFWMDLGVDGFEYDSVESFWGADYEILKEVLSTYPNSHSTGQKYLIREGPMGGYDNAEESDVIGLTHVLLSGDSDDRSVATDVMNGEMTVDDLEAHFVTFLDARRAKGQGAKAVSNYSDMPAADRALEAAVLAGSGAVMEIDNDMNYKLLEAATQQAYDTVFVALARSTAEAPGASRKRVPTGTNKSTYGIVRVSTDGSARALNLYNFSKQPAMLKVNLGGTGIEVGEVPTDLVTNKAAAAVTADYSVSLPALGYALLGFGEIADGGSDGDPIGIAGSSGSGTVAQGGKATGAGGASNTAGTNTGATTTTGGNSSPASGGDSESPVAASNDDSGCGCSMVPRSGGFVAALVVALLLAGNAKRRRSRSS